MNYVICTSPRSGSTLLCSLLRSSGVAGWPQSWFRVENREEFAVEWGVDAGERAAFLEGALAAGRRDTGVFALRMMWGTMAEVEEWLGPGLADAAPVRWVWLERRDKVAQAVSRHRAEASGIWHLGIEEAAVPGVPVYDFEAIEAYRAAAEADAAEWRDLFGARGLVPLRVYYEDLAADPVGQAGRVLAALGLPVAAMASGTVRMAGEESADWATRFRREAGLSLRA